jgi:hypothetical protein
MSRNEEVKDKLNLRNYGRMRHSSLDDNITSQLTG